MTIINIKKKMLAYRDIYGNDFLGVSEIKKAKTKKELRDIIDGHQRFIEDMKTDAKNHLRNFQKDIGLDVL